MDFGRRSAGRSGARALGDHRLRLRSRWITLAVARNAQRHGASIIAITDSENAPLAELADHVFLTGVKSYAFPDSISGACLIGNILVALTVSAYGQDGLKRIQENELEILNSGEYVTAGKQKPK